LQDNAKGRGYIEIDGDTVALSKKGLEEFQYHKTIGTEGLKI
jgi:hypothetical protein